VAIDNYILLKKVCHFCNP